MQGDGVTASAVGRDSSPAGRPGNNTCIYCRKGIGGKKLILNCACCINPAHLSCIEDWKEITTVADLNKIVGRSGILWYCNICLPTLRTYFPAEGVRETLREIDQKLENVTKMIAATNSNVKSYSEAVTANTTSPNTNEFTVLAKKLETRFKEDADTKQKQLRKVCAVVHNVSEDFNTHNVIFETLADLSVVHSSVVEISRLGKKKTSYSKPRPIRIQFKTEVTKIDFLSRYSNYERREDSFATLDLPPDLRDKEYKLRIKKRELSKENTGNKYSIRNGILFLLDRKSRQWTEVEVDIDSIQIPQRSTQQDTETAGATSADTTARINND